MKPFIFLLFGLVAILLCAIYSFYAFHSLPSISYSKNTQNNSSMFQQSQYNQAQQASTQTPLSPEDKSVKDAILIQTFHATNQSGVIFKTPNVQVEYVAADDSFQAEVLTTQITDAKHETETWLRSQGLSQQGICNLPLIFYINPAIKPYLPNNSSQANILPDGC